MRFEGDLPSCIRVHWKDVIMACPSLWAWETGLLWVSLKQKPIRVMIMDLSFGWKHYYSGLMLLPGVSIEDEFQKPRCLFTYFLKLASP